MGYEDDFRWQRRFATPVKRILGEHLFEEAPIDEDKHHATDMWVLAPRGHGQLAVACRVRSPKAYCDCGHCDKDLWKDQFTLRSRRPWGETELAKIISGWAQYVFYGFSNKTEDDLQAWVLGDLNIFRLWHGRYLAKHCELPGDERPNKDGSSWLRAYNISDLPSTFVIGRLEAAA